MIILLAHKEQRIGVFVDVQNLYYSARYIYDCRVNFAAVLKTAVQGRRLVRAIAYVIKADMMGEQTFFDALENMGYEVKAKDLQVFPGGAKKGDWDIGIAMDAIELAPKLDVVILVSGDGDYKDLVQHLKRALGCRVEAVAFGKSASSLLLNEVDEFTDLDRNTKEFLIKRTLRERPAELENTQPSPENMQLQNQKEQSQKTISRTAESRAPPRLSTKKEQTKKDVVA
ncbi:MAG: NYN domain-containing protein [Nanoarchaeota archaeon]